MENKKLSPFVRAYIECALWSSNDNYDESGGEPLDANYSIDDISEATLAEMVSECEDFQASNDSDLDASGLDEEQQGHDFWLTRNHHGAGFWDRKARGTPEGEACERLSEASKVYGSVDLYVGDDGKIYA
jgi:hypothetical protein